MVAAVDSRACAGTRPRPMAPFHRLNRPSFVIVGLNRRPLSAVNPTPLGFGPQRRSPFSVGPGYYSRLHGSGSFGIPIDYGFGGCRQDIRTVLSRRDHIRSAIIGSPRRLEITAGMLFLEVTPSTAFAFVDTVYVGTAGDLQARGVTLSPGRHWLDSKRRTTTRRPSKSTSVRRAVEVSRRSVAGPPGRDRRDAPSATRNDVRDPGLLRRQPSARGRRPADRMRHRESARHPATAAHELVIVSAKNTRSTKDSFSPRSSCTFVIVNTAREHGWSSLRFALGMLRRRPARGLRTSSRNPSAPTITLRCSGPARLQRPRTFTPP